MALPSIKEVQPNGTDAVTWVCEVQFKEDLSQTMTRDLMAHLACKPYRFGVAVVEAHKYMMVIHGLKGSTSNSNCKLMLSRAFKNASVDAEISNFAALNGYHLELFGLCHTYKENVEPEEPNELNPDEQEELSGLYDNANSKEELGQICQGYFAKRDQQALALKTENGAKASDDKFKLTWLTEMPSELEVVAKKSLREWQKLEWVLHRDRAIYGDDTLRTCPTIGHWEQFYKLYYDISPVGEPRKRREQAFKTFADHVKAVTGMVVTKADLQKTGPEQKVLRNGACYQC